VQRRALTRYADMYLVFGAGLLTCGAGDAAAALTSTDRAWLVLAIASGSFVAFALLWWYRRLDPQPLDRLPEAAPGSRVAPLGETLLQASPALGIIVALTIGATRAGAPDSAIEAAFFLGWGVQELRLRHLIRRWERRRKSLLLIETPAIFILKKPGNEYRLPVSAAL
jgi:hypothetical protein